MLRMLAGTAYSRQIMHCLLARGQRLISEHQSYSNTPTPCPELQHFTHHNEQSHYSWALSLIQYFQQAQSNIYTTPLFPQTTIPMHCTQTPIADETVLGGEWGVRVVGGSSVFKLPSVYTAIGVVDSKG